MQLATNILTILLEESYKPAKTYMLNTSTKTVLIGQKYSIKILIAFIPNTSFLQVNVPPIKIRVTKPTIKNKANLNFLLKEGYASNFAKPMQPISISQTQ